MAEGTTDSTEDSSKGDNHQREIVGFGTSVIFRTIVFDIDELLLVRLVYEWVVIGRQNVCLFPF